MVTLMMDSEEKKQIFLEWLQQNPQARQVDILVQAVEISPEDDQ